MNNIALHQKATCQARAHQAYRITCTSKTTPVAMVHLLSVLLRPTPVTGPTCPLCLDLTPCLPSRALREERATAQACFSTRPWQLPELVHNRAVTLATVVAAAVHVRSWATMSMCGSMFARLKLEWLAWKRSTTTKSRRCKTKSPHCVPSWHSSMLITPKANSKVTSGSPFFFDGKGPSFVVWLLCHVFYPSMCVCVCVWLVVVLRPALCMGGAVKSARRANNGGVLRSTNPRLSNRRQGSRRACNNDTPC